MKRLGYFFNAVVVFTAGTLILSIVTTIQKSRQASEPAPITIPTPAMGR